MTTWVELRALEKGWEEAEHRAWERARFIAHLNYLCQPVWGKGQPKEKDPRRFHPFPWDKTTQAPPPKADKQPTKREEKKLNELFSKIRK